MLQSLSIRNYALIEHLEFEPGRHLNIITGETGAGKSIMLGALGLLMGNRADSKSLYREGKKCMVEGSFEVSAYYLQSLFELHDVDYEDVCILRREISAAGKSRAFINDTPVTLDVLKAIGPRLMDIHSQYDTRQLGSNEYQLYLTDTYACHSDLVLSYKEDYEQWQQDEKAYNKLKKEAANIKKAQDYDQFILTELEKAELEEGEQESLEEEIKILENAEEIKTSLTRVLDLINNSDSCVNDSLYEAETALENLTEYSSLYGEAKDRLSHCIIELKDICDELEKQETTVELDPARLAFVDERLNLLYGLQKKHLVSHISELITMRNELRNRASQAESLDIDIERLQKKAAISLAKAEKSAKKLSDSRQKITKPLAKELIDLLKEMGILHAQIDIQQKTASLTETGQDEMVLLFSANKGVAPQPLREVASGGEFSRLMLALKYVLAGKSALPTLIFDEIDTGISGEIAMKVGFMMRRMAGNHQIMAITHLPQIAARAHEHFYIYKDNQNKDRTVSKVRQLDEGQHIAEIAQMISGEPPTETSMNNARELIDMLEAAGQQAAV